jgi:hypothetical protein
MLRSEGQRRVEEKAVAIDAANAEMERDIKRQQLNKENMWTNVTQAGLLEAFKLLGHFAPGFGQLASALIQGKPVPPPPGPLPTNGAQPTPTQPQLPPAATGEKEIVDRFIDAAEKHKVDEQYTAAEKLFGKDDDKGAPISPGVFSRPQVAILLGVHMGSLGIEALDALLPDSGKPEALQLTQVAQAMAFLTPTMSADIRKVLELRTAARTR